MGNENQNALCVGELLKMAKAQETAAVIAWTRPSKVAANLGS